MVSHDLSSHSGVWNDLLWSVCQPLAQWAINCCPGVLGLWDWGLGDKPCQQVPCAFVLQQRDVIHACAKPRAYLCTARRQAADRHHALWKCAVRKTREIPGLERLEFRQKLHVELARNLLQARLLLVGHWHFCGRGFVHYDSGQSVPGYRAKRSRIRSWKLRY